MSVVDDFTRILEQGQEAQIIPFLQTLDKAQKKQLVPALKKLYKTYSEYKEDRSGHYRVKWTDPQREILGIAGFVCHNQKDFTQMPGGALSKRVLDAILPWYCPTWFSDFINNQANNGFTPRYMDYAWYLQLVEKGYVTLSEPFIAKILPDYIFNHTYQKHEYLPQNLLKNEVTLRDHIWHMFSYESFLYNTDRYLDVPEKTKDGLWITTLLKYINEGKIDRKRLLKSSLGAANSNFNQLSAGWFIDLFNRLEPSKTELLNLQDDLLHLLNSPHSKPVTAALKYLKDIGDDAAFNIDAFLDHAPLQLSSESKTTVATALMVLDKLAKKYKHKAETIMAISCQAFIHQDNSLQVRAAKLLQKYGDAASEDLKAALAAYQDALLFDARSLLTAFLDNGEEAPAEASHPHEQPEAQHALVEIAYPQTFDELVFLASQAFDNNQPYHFDLLPAALLHFQGEMTAKNISKLTPAFQRAYTILVSDFVSTMGYLDNMLATFLIDYGQLLVSFYPTMSEPVNLIRASFLKKEADKKAQWTSYKSRILNIKGWEVFTHSLSYKPHKHLLLNAFFLLERKINLPLLSTPTHQPCWVSPLTLVQRLIKYKAANIAPADMDFQVAVSRCSAEHQQEALELAARALTGEYRQLISFMLGGDYHPQENYKYKPVWLVAALTRAKQPPNPQWFAYSTLNDEYLMGNFNWQSLIEPYTYPKWDYVTRKNVQTAAKRSKLSILLGHKHKKYLPLKICLPKYCRKKTR